MKKQTHFAIFLMIIALMTAGVLITGIIGLQKLTAMSREAERKYNETAAECERINKDLAHTKDWEKLRATYDATLASLDKGMVDYKYLPTYLEQLQQTAMKTGNAIISIRPRPVIKLDSNSPLLKASYDRWLASNPEIAAAAQATASGAEGQTGGNPQAAQPGTTMTYKMQQFTLEIEGDYSSILRLLDALRSFPKLVYVHSVSLTPASGNDPEHLKAMLETYAIITPDQYQHEEQKATPAGGQQP